MPAPRTGGAWTASCTDGGRCRVRLRRLELPRGTVQRARPGPPCRHRIPRGAKGSGSGRLPLGLQRLRLRRDCDGPRREVEAPRSRLGRGPSNPGVEEPAPRQDRAARLRGGLEALRPTLRQALVLHGLHVVRIDGEPGPSQGARLRSELRRGGLRDDSLAGVLFGSVVREVPSPARGPLLLRARRGPPWKATLRGLLGGTSRRRTCSPGRAQAKPQSPDPPRATESRTNRRAEGPTTRGG